MSSRAAAAAALVLALLATALLALAAGGCRAPARPDLVLITLDTVRADRLGAYGAPGDPTPNLDALAREGVVFEHAAAPMGLTLPSHFSILTSRYPRQHGVLNNGTVLPDDAVTVAERLREAGYRTGAFVGVRLLAPENGTAQGFERFGFPRDSPQRPAPRVVEEALEWLGAQPSERPVFLWVHLYDAHIPYDPPKELVEGADPRLLARFPSLHWPILERIARRHDGDVPAAILDHARRLYAAEVSYADRWVGRLLAGVAAERARPRLVAAAADHGECFENGVFFEHGNCLFQGALRVPLIVRFPGGEGAGSRVERQVSLIDVAPTLLAAAGVAPPPSFVGRALRPAGAGRRDRSVLIQAPLYQSGSADRRSRRLAIIRSVAGVATRALPLEGEVVGLVSPDWKYLRRPGETVLFRLPDETRDLGPERPEVRDRFAGELERALARYPLEVAAPSILSPELKKSLGALGYVE